MTNKKLTIRQGGIIFSITEVLFLLFLFFNPFSNYFLSGSIGEIGAILLPAVILIIIFKKDIKENLKIRKVGIINSIIIIVSMWFTIPITISLSYISILIVNIIFKNNILPEVPIPTNTFELMLSIIVIGFFAALCEELLFRGALFSSVESFGIKRSFVFISILFALFHFSFEKVLGVFLLSLVICYIVYRTNSIFAGILAHFVNNITVVLISFFALKIIPEGISSEQSLSEIINQPTILMITTIGVLVFVSIICTAVVISFMYLLKTRTEKIKIKFDKKVEIHINQFITYIPGILIMIGMYIYLIVKYIS